MTLLIIEDNRSIRENTKEFLEMEGYEVYSSPNAKTAYDELEIYNPDLIICDIRMPDMDGFEFLEKLGAHQTFKSIPVIFFSAKCEKNDITKGLGLGAYDYIAKPSDLEDLLISIKRCLDKRKFSEK